MKNAHNSAPLHPLVRFVVLGLSSCFYTSTLPVKLARTAARLGFPFFFEKKWTGAGIIGSLWGVATFYALIPYGGLTVWLLLLSAAAATFVAHWGEIGYGHHDDPRIVIDEWIGMLFALWGLETSPVWAIVLAFCFFRVFDSWKGPWGNALQRLPGGWGVTMDDIAAGALSNILVRLLTL